MTITLKQTDAGKIYPIQTHQRVHKASVHDSTIVVTVQTGVVTEMQARSWKLYNLLWSMRTDNNHDNVPPPGAIGIITSVWIVRELGGRWLPPTTIGVKAARIFIRADLTPCCCWNAYTRNSNMGSQFTPDLRVTWQCYGMVPMFPL